VPGVLLKAEVPQLGALRHPAATGRGSADDDHDGGLSGSARRGTARHKAARKQRNPSAQHEALLGLMRLFPETPLRLVLADLQLSYRIRGPLLARSGDPDALGLRIDARLDYHAGGGRSSGQPVLAIIVEAQLSRESDLRWRLCPYLGFVSHDAKCATDVVVLCATQGIAQQMAEPVMLGARGNSITPKAVGPADVPVITSSREALADPGRLVLSAWYHTRRGVARRDAMVSLLVEVIGTLNEIDPERARRYYWLALDILPAQTARRLQEMTESDLVVFAMKKYYPEDYEAATRESRAEGLRQGRREGRREGRAEGRTEGLAQGIVVLLEARDIEVPAGIRKRILSTHSLKQLNEWLRRAATASSADEVVAA